MNDLYKRRLIIILAMAEISKRAIENTASEDMSSLVNGEDIIALSEGLAVNNLHKQLRQKGAV